ncbi:MAG: hypothetical protein ACM359_03860 [Bacillota bacterium]
MDVNPVPGRAHDALARTTYRAGIEALPDQEGTFSEQPMARVDTTKFLAPEYDL